MRIFVPLMLFLLLGKFSDAQQIQSPSDFLGYKLGDSFTPYYKVVDYYKYLAGASKNIRLLEYGKTYEGRPLFVAFIASESNLERLESIRKDNIGLTGPGDHSQGKGQPVIVWLSYNVHGNEAVSTEASLKTVYELVNPVNKRPTQWLENTVVIMDPCLNPDGRERYVNFYNPVKNLNPDPLQFTREHYEPWPGGRSNHYYFDLNRDWAWQTQVETKQRMALYNKWLPQVHVDFHEQGINEPYYFAPAAEPFHQDITKWQREFQTTIGRNNARYFDERGWLYFTRERFDLLYPSYGDTYPTYNGSIGMTFEQGGSGRAGLAVITRQGDTLTLGSRIEHHFTTGLSTIEVSSANASKVITEFIKYFETSREKPSGKYKSYVIKGDNPEKLKSLASLLTVNGIDFGYGVSRTAVGLNYLTGKDERFSINTNDMVISAYQSKSVLVKVLFEPDTYVSDSVTYDITAWALPYAYGLKAYASADIIRPQSRTFPVSGTVKESESQGNPVAYVAGWNSVADVKFLAGLLKKNIKVRYSEIPFETGGKQFSPGTLIIARAGNELLKDRFAQTITGIAQQAGVILQPLLSGFADKGPDLGSDKIRLIKKNKVALVAGEQTSSLSVGEIWHFFEQQIGYPLSVINAKDIERVNINEFDVIIYPNGYYEDIAGEKLMSWIRGGGKLIALEDAVAQLVGKKGFSITTKEEEKDNEKNKDPYEELRSYAERERELVKSNIPGAIFKVDMDNSHPLAFGLPNYYFTLKQDDRIYSFMNNGWNVGVLKKDNYVSGFTGTKTRKKLTNGLLFGVQESGDGSIVYLTDDPLFRGFWENGKLLFSNAVFMVGQ